MNVHATCIRIGGAGRRFGAPAGAGVLLLGKSGAGKSDLALRLIGLGAQLVADDRTELDVVRGRLMASAPRPIAGLLEVRGVGIVKVAQAPRVTIALAVELAKNPPRMPDDRAYRPPLKLALRAWPRLIALDPFEASAPEKLLVAAARQRLLR
jgi:serine kinase of HPr protein (carbohydrate metabolism regulator)